MDFTKYENKLPYPSATEVSTTYYYKAGKTVAIKAGTETKFMKGFEGFDLSTCTTEKVTDKQNLQKLRDAYHAEDSRIHDLFLADVKEDLGITNNPKADKLMRKAWDHGHSSGYAEVYNCALDLVELIED